MRVTLKRGNDQVVTLTGLKNKETSEYLNAATVTASLNDSKGRPVPAFQSVPMSYVPASTGNYDWIIDGKTMMLPKNTSYELVIAARQGELDYRVVYDVSVTD